MTDEIRRAIDLRFPWPNDHRAFNEREADEWLRKRRNYRHRLLRRYNAQANRIIADAYLAAGCPEI